MGYDRHIYINDNIKLGVIYHGEAIGLIILDNNGFSEETTGVIG